jgi:hypothetical protein
MLNKGQSKKQAKTPKYDPKTGERIGTKEKKSTAQKVTSHIISYSILYISLGVVGCSQLVGFNYQSAYKSAEDLHDSQQHVVVAKDFEGISITEVDSPFNDLNTARLVFSYDCPSCRLFQFNWGKVIDKLDVNIATEQTPVRNSQLMTVYVYKAYAIAEQLKLVPKLNKYMYKSILEDEKTFNNLGDLQDFYTARGVNNHKFISYLSNESTEALFEKYSNFNPESYPSVLLNGKIMLNFDSNIDPGQLAEAINYISNNFNAYLKEH